MLHCTYTNDILPIMIIYSNTKPIKKKLKPKTVREQNADWLRAHGSDGKKYTAVFKAFVPPKNKVIERVSKGKVVEVQHGNIHSCAKTSIMDPMKLNKESEEIKNKIISKSKQISIPYNKGGYMYISEGYDPTDLGKKK